MSEKIIELMKCQGISKNVLADKAKINYNTLRGYLDSGNNIPLKNLKKIAKALHTTVSYLIGEDVIQLSQEEKKLLKKIFSYLIRE